MAGKDKELEAIGIVVSVIEPLGEDERKRVLEYVIKRLGMATVRSIGERLTEPVETHTSATWQGTDIRSFAAEKQPRSANEMTALVAYYVSELAPGSERSDTITADTIRRYFKMAAFPLPKVTKNALTNAAAAGYLDSASRGEYRLNPVGYNLVVHGLPRSGSTGSARTTGKKAKAKAKAKRR